MVLIDGPVSDWSNKTMKSICGASLKYDDSDVENGRLKVDGYWLSDVKEMKS